MLEILQFYVSGFWTWAGITWGIVAIGAAISQLARSVLWGRE